MGYAKELINKFKTKEDLDERKRLSVKCREKSLVPIIAYPGSKDTPYPVGISKTTGQEYMKNKYVVHQDKTFFDFMYNLRKSINLDSTEALVFITASGVQPQANDSMGRIYANHKDEDGFLYIIYSKEKAYGC